MPPKGWKKVDKKDHTIKIRIDEETLRRLLFLSTIEKSNYSDFIRKSINFIYDEYELAKLEEKIDEYQKSKITES